MDHRRDSRLRIWGVGAWIGDYLKIELLHDKIRFLTIDIGNKYKMVEGNSVTEMVKEAVLGHDEIIPEMSQTRPTFEQNALKDEVTGELYMTTKEFVEAIAPANQDYVMERCCGLSVYYFTDLD